LESPKLILIDAHIGREKIADIVRKENIGEWIALIPDYNLTLSIEDTLKPYAKRLSTGNALQEVVRNIRKPYYQVTSELGEKYNSLAWWSTSISERNTMTNRLFLNCCYVFLAKRALTISKDTCFICDSVPVLALISNISPKHYETSLHTSFSLRRYISNGYIGNIRQALYKFIKKYYIWFITKAHYVYHRAIKGGLLPKPSSVDIVLHTWVDEKSFGTDGTFIDRYFTVLPEWLRKQGHKVATFVTLSAIQRSYWQALNFFRLKPENYIIPDDFHKWYDNFLALFLYLKKLSFKYDNLILEGVDVSSLFYEEKQKDSINLETLNFILMKRLAESRIKPLMIIDGFENMVSDKMIILGARKHLSDTILKGFFHIPVATNNLCNFIGQSEMQFAPLPDQVICNGEVYRKILETENYPKKLLRVGTALRYIYLWKTKTPSLNNSDHSMGVLRILVPLPLARNAAMELIQKVIGAVPEKQPWRIYLKPHPMGLDVINALPKLTLSRVEILTDSMDDSLQKSDVVVTAASSAALDSVLSGKPVIRIGREADLDFDPLSNLDGFENVFYETDEISQELEKYSRKLGCGEKLIDFDPLDLLGNLFAPPTEEYLSVFVSKSIN
jgi:hypothetical protein